MTLDSGVMSLNLMLGAENQKKWTENRNGVAEMKSVFVPEKNL